MGNQNNVTGPDLKLGVALEQLSKAGKLVGQVDGEAVLLIKNQEQIFAVGALCSHYGAPLEDGIVVENSVRCPWHHACFDLKTGEATKAPALNPISAWEVEIKNGMIFVTKKKSAQSPKKLGMSKSRFVIIGSGAAGHSASEMLRRRGYDGEIVLLTEDKFLPYDRPNLSKDYLAGKAPEEWIPLRDQEFFKQNEIKFELECKVSAIDVQRKLVNYASAKQISYDKCLIATGGSPRRLDVEGSDWPHVHYLRSLSDCKKLIASLRQGLEVVIVGSGFIGLEAAAALKSQGCNVTIVTPQDNPLSNKFGKNFGAFLKSIHEENGVKFLVNDSVQRIKTGIIELKSGHFVRADLVLVATGVTPNTSLAESAGLNCNDGIIVNEYLRTANKDIFAAGDVARWSSSKRDGNYRIEHWVVAQRQGQIAARNMLGENIAFNDIPFFWSHQFDLTFGYIGFGSAWTHTKIYGSLEKRDAAIAFYSDESFSGLLTIGRDQLSLLAEEAMENSNFKGLQALLESQ